MKRIIVWLVMIMVIGGMIVAVPSTIAFPGNTDPDVTIPSLNYAGNIAIGDINGDLLVDIVDTSDYANGYSAAIYYQHYNKTFSSPQDITLQTGQDPQGTSIGDLNNDTLNDLVVVSRQADIAQIHYQRSNHSLSTTADVIIPTDVQPTDVEIADLNNDSLNDLIYTNKGYTSSGSVAIHYQEQNYQINTTPNIILFPGYDPQFLDVGDMNNDGLNDIAVVMPSEKTAALFYQNVNNTFNITPDVTLGSLGTPYSVQIADVNGDDLNDLVIGDLNTVNPLFIFYQKMDNTYPSTPDVIISVDRGVRALAVGDLNRDNLNDIVIVNSYSPFFGAIYFQNADNTMSTTPDVILSVGNTPSSIGLGDLNRDGLNDIAITNTYSNNILIYFSESDVVNAPPMVNILYPDGGEMLSGIITVQWNGSDPDGDKVGYDFYLSNDYGATWSDVIYTITFTEAQINITHSWMMFETFNYSDGNTYLLRVIAKDGSGPSVESRSSRVFIIDNTLPNVNVLGIVNGRYYNVNVTPFINISDAHLNADETIITLNDVPFESGATISSEGDYVLFVYAMDEAGNTAQETIIFAIDKTKPNVTVTGVENGGYYNASITPTIKIFDINLNTTGIALNDEVFVSGTTVSEEGDYILYVEATDKAGNTATANVTFTIDKTKPTIDITGVVNDTYYNVSVTSVVDITDLNLNTTSITLNGNPFTSGDAVSEEGDYILFVQASDKAGNNVSKTIYFVIDKANPNITISNVVGGTYYNISVTPVIEFNDTNPNITTMTLNGAPFDSGTTITGEDDYVLVAYASDKAGNIASQTIIFTIDKTKPIITISGVEDGAYYNTDIAPVVDITEDNLNITSITLNDNPFTSGTTISTGDTYVLVVQADDKAGNTANKTITFIIDKTAPAITIAESSQTTNKNIFIMSWSESEVVQYYEISTDEINWVNVSTSTQYTFALSKGGNTLYVRGTDLAGNTGTDMITVTYKKEERKGFIPGFELMWLALAFCLILAFKRRKKV